MNERIEELWEQAKAESSQWLGSKPAITITYDELEKLAELVIQKCVAISDDYVKDCTCEEHINCRHPRSAIGRKIREHFGVEQ